MLMSFNFKLMFQLVCKSLFACRGTNARLTPKRMAAILILFPVFILFELANCIGFMLDEILFRDYRRSEVNQPVFIVGVPRSGTTFMHRLFAKDREMFTSIKSWEILFAPSVTQKKFLMALGAIDRRIGSPIRKKIIIWEEKGLQEMNRMHKGSLFLPEEDEQILIHIFSSFFLGFAFPFEEAILPFWWFDEKMPARDRTRIMSFYKRCVQCHMYVFGKGKRFLSKNPAFCSKVRSLNETFPDAKVICMVRTPLEVLPSMLSLFAYISGIFMSPIEPYPMHEALLKVAAYIYRYPIDQLEKWPPERQSVIRYNTLVQNPEQTVLSLYDRFGLNMSPQYRQVLQEEMHRARQYKSSHRYSLEQCGLTREQVVSDYSDIFERFGFDTE
jgi:hypothetical protein